MEHIFELRIKDQIEERSSQLLRNLSSCEKKAWKKFKLLGSNLVQAWIFFRLSFRNCLSCVVTARIFLLFDLSSAIEIYVPYIYIHPSRVYYELTIWPAPSWLDSSVGRALHRHRRGHGFESRSSLNFFQAFFSQLLKLRSNCEDLSSIWNGCLFVAIVLKSTSVPLARRLSAVPLMQTNYSVYTSLLFFQIFPESFRSVLNLDL